MNIKCDISICRKFLLTVIKNFFYDFEINIFRAIYIKGEQNIIKIQRDVSDTMNLLEISKQNLITNLFFFF